MIKSKLYNCGMDRRGDSFFVRVGTVITSTRNLGYYNFPRTKRLPNYKIYPIEVVPGKLDAGSMFFIQVKENNGTVKTVFIDEPFAREANEQQVKDICDFIRSVNKELNSKIWDSWDSTVVHAFQN